MVLSEQRAGPPQKACRLATLVVSVIRTLLSVPRTSLVFPEISRRLPAD